MNRTRHASNPYLDEIGRRSLNLEIREFSSGAPEFPRHVREALRSRYAWAIPNDEAIAVLVSLGPLVEIGAGTGYWAHLIAEAGGEIICYDREPYLNRWCDGTQWHLVHKGGPGMVRRHQDRALFLCWPPYTAPMAHIALRLYRGSTVAYVGEDGSGCTGDGNFHEMLDQRWTLEQEIALPQYAYIHDALWIYARNSA